MRCRRGCGSGSSAPRMHAKGSDMISLAAVDSAVVLEEARLDGALRVRYDFLSRCGLGCGSGRSVPRWRAEGIRYAFLGRYEAC